VERIGVTGRYSRQRTGRPFSGNKFHECQQCVDSNAGKRAGLSVACISLIMRELLCRRQSTMKGHLTNGT